MRRLQRLGVLFLSTLPAAAQTCPAINFRGASIVALGSPNQTVGGLQRLPDGSFTLHSYTEGAIASVQQNAPTPDFQQNFLNCSGHSPVATVPPANWSFLSDPLLGTMPRNPAIGALLGSGTTVGLCLGLCNASPTALQMLVGTPTFNIASAPVYGVSPNAIYLLTADLNKDDLGDVIVLNPDVPATVSVYLMQSNGTLAPPSTALTLPAGGSLSATVADFDHDGNLDLAITSATGNSITILLGNGNGTFRAPITVPTVTQPGNIVAADFNGDSKLDLAVTTIGGVAVHFGTGDGNFQPAQMYPTPGFLVAIAAADLNKDNKPDIVAVDANDGVALVLLNAGNGTFPSVSGYLVGSGATSLFLMDFDWDGNTDIVFGAGHPDALTPPAFDSAVTVLFGNGDGTFNGEPAYQISGNSGSAPGGLALADFTGDGKLDAIAGSTSGISLLTGHGDGTFSPQNLSLPGSTALAAGDFDGDTKPDFVATTSSGILVYLNNGNGTFRQSAAITTTSNGNTAVAVGDFNHDNKLDFAVVDSGGGPSAVASVFLGNGNGTFQSPRTVVVGSTPVALQVADVNGDGKLDLVVTNNGVSAFISSSDPGGVVVLLGNGDGTFQPAVPYSAGVNPTYTLVADINGDNRPDLITSTTLNFSTSTYGLSVRLNLGNGTFGAPQALTSGFVPGEIAAADFSGDSKVDLLVAHCCGNTEMGYYLGNGTGNFQPEVLLPALKAPKNVRVADLNGDGKPDAVFTLLGPYVAAATNISGATTGGGGGGPTAITIQTNPAGLQFTVDGGAAQTAPATLTLAQGSHTIAVASAQPGMAGTQYSFASWSDSGAASHNITVGAPPTTYTATYTTQYLLTTAIAPPGGGTISANPTSASGYYNAGTNVQLTASPSAGYQLSAWAGDLSGSANPQSIVMNAPHNVAASFSTNTNFCTFTLSSATASAPATGTSTVETCPSASGQPNCGIAPEVSRSFTVTPSAACGAWTATSSSPGVLQIVSGASASGFDTVNYVLLNNTHNLPQDYFVTISSAGASATYTVTQAGSGDNEVYRQVYALYEQLLGRDPDPGGFAFWTGSGGAALGQMADSFLTSPEVFNSDFVVMATYQAATGSAPTFAQYTTAVANLRSGAQTVTSLLTSLINGSYTATNLYQNLLGRAPSAGEISSANGQGLANWFQTLIGYPNSTTPVNSPNNEFQSTGTYHTTLAADHTNALYVQLVYYVTVGRDPDPSGFAFWLGVANDGGPGVLFQGNAGYPTRIQILGPGTPNQGFIGSPEFQALFSN